MINPITLTPAAIDEIKSIMSKKGIPQNYGLRIGVKGAGCSGVTFVLGFDQITDKDSQFEIENIPVYIEKRHIMHLMGIEVEFIENEKVRGFHFKTDDKS